MARNPYFQLPHLALPWEVIENVIEQSRNESQVLYNVSTTCHQLRPRSLSLLVARVKLKSEGKVLAFCDFLRGKPYLQPLVRSLVVSPTDFAPVPLLSLLPGLGDIVLITHGYDDTRREERPTTCLNKSIPWYYKHGTRIETLHLYNLSFSTCCAFSRMLSAFTCVKDLTGMDLLIGTKEGSHPLQIQGSNQRLAERLALRVLTLDWDVEEAAVDLLLDLTRSTVERLLLTVQHSYKFVDPDAQLYSFSKAADWKQLQFLTLKLLFEPESMLAAIDFFDAFHPPHLQGVTCLLSSDLISVLYCINETEESELPFQELEQILLGFANPKISLAVDGPLHPRRQRFWTQELGQNFPTLLERNAFVVTSSSSRDCVGHDKSVECLANSLDSSWIATGSYDSTIILWNSRGEVAKEWVAHGPGGVVNSLAFSPDSHYLVSAGSDGMVAIWDVNQDASKTATLAGHTHVVASCAWSQDGTLIASACDENSYPYRPGAPEPEPESLTVRLWDAQTFQQVHVFEGPHEGAIWSVAFSPDGRWLVSRGEDHYCCVWDVARRTLHTVLRGHGGLLRAAAFHPRSTRLATASMDHTIRIWDVEKGETLLTLAGHKNEVFAVAFSPDGHLIVSASGDETAKVWDANSGAMLFSIEGHDEPCRRISFSPSGHYIASGSNDRTVRLWRTDDGSCLDQWQRMASACISACYCRHNETIVHPTLRSLPLSFKVDSRQFAIGVILEALFAVPSFLGQ